MKFRSPKTPQAGFQLAPMIDIVFLLLIFFIVSWNYGDQATPYQEIIRVLDTCQKAGIWNIAFATQGPEAAAPQP